MQILTRCARCGVLVEPRQMPTSRRGETVWLWSAAATCTVDTSGTVAMNFVSTSVLCPDCMGRLKAWLSGGPEDPQGQEEAGQGAGGDGADRLAADLARAVKNVTAFGLCMQQLACGYFGHVGGVACLDRQASVHRDECPAYGGEDGGPESCWAAMLDGISRRCEELGIDLKAGDR